MYNHGICIQGKNIQGQWKYNDGSAIECLRWQPGQPSGNSNFIIMVRILFLATNVLICENNDYWIKDSETIQDKEKFISFFKLNFSTFQLNTNFDDWFRIN